MMRKILSLCCFLLTLFCHAEVEIENHPFKDIHPYAFYYLTGGNYNVSDLQNAVISVNASKFKITNRSQEVPGLKLYNRGYKPREFKGFSKSHGDLGTESFDFSVYKRLTTSNCFVIDCTCNRGGSLTSVYHLFIRKHRKNYYDSGKIKMLKNHCHS